jgi:hypothetical protein
MDPLSVTASIVGILTAATQVATLLGKIKDAPKSISDVLTEVDDIKLIFSAFQEFIKKAAKMRGGRSAMIQIDDIVVMLTRTVLVFSELETLVSPLSKKDNNSYLNRVTWTRVEPGVIRLVNQLQRQKTSLTLLLQIIQWYA